MVLDAGSVAIDTASYHDSRILVQLEAGSTMDFMPSSVQIAGLESLGGNLWAVRLAEGSVDQALAALANLPQVVFAEPDYAIQISATTPDDPGFGFQYALHNSSDADIDAVEAWEITTGSGRVIVAIIDTGVDYTHPDLAANMWRNPGEIAGNGIDDDQNGYVDDIYGYDFYSNDSNPMDTNGHGTHVAGTIGAVGNNGIGVSGVAWNVQIMALRFIGPGGGYTSDAIRALNYAVANGATISNNSWGGGGYSNALRNAIAGAGSQGHIFVAAAGNDRANNDTRPSYPASYNLDNIVSVASTTSSDELSSSSNFGARTVDLGAPGSNILSTVPDGYAYFSGTSMAAPHVTGAIALLRDQHPDWSYQEVIQQLLSTVDPLPDLAGRTVSGGPLNLHNALGQVSTLAPQPVEVEDHFETSLWSDFDVDKGWTARRVGDFNGDGRDDIAQFRVDDGGWYICLAQPGGGFSIQLWSKFNKSTGWSSQRVGDFNGDGRDDIAQFRAGNGTWWISLSEEQADGTFRFVTEKWADLANSGWIRHLIGDFNSDGCDDIASFRAGNGKWFVSLSDFKNGGNTAFVTSRWADLADQGWTKHVVGDFNGDGRDDIAGFRAGNGTWHVSLSDAPGSNSFTTTRWADLANSGWTSHLVGDFNGDGRDDIAGFRAGNGTWRVSLSNAPASNSFTTTLWANLADSGWTRHFVGDFNGDDRDDIASFRAGGGKWFVSLSEAPDSLSFTTTRWAVLENSGWTLHRPGDFNGDGQDDIAGFRASTGTWHVSLAVTSSPPSTSVPSVEMGLHEDEPDSGPQILGFPSPDFQPAPGFLDDDHEDEVELLDDVLRVLADGEDTEAELLAFRKQWQPRVRELDALFHWNLTSV